MGTIQGKRWIRTAILAFACGVLLLKVIDVEFRNEPAQQPSRVERSLSPKAFDGQGFDERAWNISDVEREREVARQEYRAGNGFLWFVHLQKAAGTAICHKLSDLEKTSGVPPQDIGQACYLGGLDSSKGCAHDLWMNGFFDESGCRAIQPGSSGFPLRTMLNSLCDHCGLHDTVNITQVVSHVRRIERKIKMLSEKKRIVSSERVFMPRSVLRAWLIDGDPQLARAFSSWSFLLNVQHPAERVYSAFHFHEWFDPCQGNFSYCLQTPLFTRGPHRNKLVKELSGWYLPCEFGTIEYPLFEKDGKYVNSECRTEATEASAADLEIAKLVISRFLPVLVVDGQPTVNQHFGPVSLQMRGILDSLGYSKHAGTPASLPVLNNNPKFRMKMSKMDFERVVQLNSLDIQLYEYVVARGM